MTAILQWLWRYADSDRLLFPAVRLKDLPETLCAELLDGKYLIPAAEQLRTIWDDDESHEIYDTVYADGSLHHFYHSGSGTVEVPEDDLKLFRVSFRPFADVVRVGLNCTGSIAEKLPGKIWVLGAAGQQRREVYLVRNWTDNACSLFLQDSAVKKGSLIIHIGKRPAQDKFDDNQVYALDTMIDFDGVNFLFDGQCVFDNLKDMVAGRPRNVRKKSLPIQKKHQNSVETLLQAWFRWKYENAKRQRNGESLIRQSTKIMFANQKELAKVAKVPEAAISRMKKEWYDDMSGTGWGYILILQTLGRDSTDFIDFYNEHKECMKKIGIEY